MAKKKPFTFESNLDKIIVKIEEKPQKVMNTIGQNLVKEIKSTTMKSQFHQRRSILTKTLGYWARKQEKDLQIGFKMSIHGIVGRMITGAEQDPIKPVVVKNAELIQQMIAAAIDEINKE
ncbi:MAG: hypothetical protein K0S47_3201 [Herbinix sp.]|jgi:hypothetical protein|nr:hypothetical protein [Herbinix sp.]